MIPLAPFPQALQPWQNFYMLTGAAAATLAGLMFVAVTFGASLITKETSPYARAWVDPAFMNLVQVLFTGCLATVPVLTPAIFGGTFLFVVACRLARLREVYTRYREAHAKNGDVEASDWLSGIVFPLLGHLVTIASAVGLFVGDARALTGLALATGGMLFLGVYGAWELLVWMVVEVVDRRDGKGEEARRNGGE